MQARLPFEILPTASIVAAPLVRVVLATTTPTPVQSISSVVASKKPVIPKEVVELDEEQGKRIIALIYEKDGSMEKKGTTVIHTKQPQQQLTQSRRRPPHQSSFYIEKECGSNNASITSPNEVVIKKEMNLLDRVSDYLSIESKGLIKLIDRDLLVENGITIEDLVGPKCDIGISDLKNAGIVTNVHDLRLLGFKMSDVVINRRRFQAQQLADLFQLNYHLLRKMKGVNFGILDMLRCQFSPNELQALDVSFDYMIRNNSLNADQLLLLNFSLQDLVSLHFHRDHLEILDITTSQQVRAFGWGSSEFKEFNRRVEEEK